MPNQKKKAQLFTCDFLLIIAVCGLGRIGNHMQSVTVPLYMQSIGFTATVAGFMTTIYTISSLVLRPFTGVLLDRLGRWPIVTMGTALFAITSALFPMSKILWLLVFIRILQGIGFSTHATAINTMGTDVLPESRLSEGIGYMGLTNSLSTAVAPALALMMMESFGYQEAFLTIFLIAAVASVLCFFIRYEKKKPIRHAPEQITWANLFERKSLFPSVLIMLMAGANVALGTFLATYAGAVGIEGVGIFFTVNAIAMTIARLLGGKLTQWIGKQTMMILGFVGCFLGFLLIYVARSQLLLWLSATLYGFGYGMVYPLLNAMAVVNAAPTRRGAANATFLMLMDLGIGLGSFMWGIAIDWLGVQWLFLLCSFSVVIATGIYIMVVFYSKKRLVHQTSCISITKEEEDPHV